MANVVRARKMISGDDLRILNNYRAIFQKLCAGVHMTIVTDTVQEPEAVFGNYAKVFNMYIKRGQLDLITIAEAPDDLENFFFL
ncbi:hypothetical protein BZF66_05140 [Salmonella enterica]|nr:hypothetical protein CPT_Munch_394 [Salmonella phage Munch]EAZ2022684.1 hypothetical protein [Salmonella enterica]ECV9083818.1 hypothetical protein [Salmonella enterica subsp. enterica serovar Infantis]MCP0435590.1 hypothetical protein [Salmonella enterica subsp. enterica serovar Mbandaka]ECC6867702.1 hypothetical protein [Salmonella enterica]